jgi:hypothetical protein
MHEIPPFRILRDAKGGSVTQDEEPTEPEVQALIRAYVACRVAMDALPGLPADVRDEVDEAVTRLCHIVGPVLERRYPGFFDR